ncbi:restriction endonuclease subunit S [Enterococcus hirae]|uniref:restriction endonuclease subunit S n=1 Tax=Enterococcus hirae TaxID=1354 RepID=UPI001A96BF3D|nr:restriction endonuclease subunit S [Enterococcus hirae]MBO1102675.1 restriction endonuclease subunit S [Enterococcus hirae]
MSKDKQPEIRFPGFTEAWEQRKLGEIVQITMGQSPNSENYTENPEDYILVQGNADMKNNRVVPRVWTTQVTKQAEKGDLILSVRAPVGDIGKTDYDVVLGRGVAAVKGNDFIFQKLRKMKETGYWNRFSTGSTFESINSNDIREALITIPDGEEQKKIGIFFKQLDDTIALQQRKLDLLKETKKGFLQKMFPKNGAKVPEIRFPGFTEDWEQRKLSEMAGFSKGNGYSKADLVEKGHPVILYGRLYTKYETVIEKVDTFAELKEKSVISNGGEVIVPASGETPEDISRASVVDVSGVALGGDLNIIKTKSELDPTFLALTISNGSQQKEMTKRAQGKSVVHLHNSDLKEVNLLYPKLDEQVKIGSFFKKLDVAITLHQRKLDLLKETKKGFLQKMFV